jgi:hypothetical protein
MNLIPQSFSINELIPLLIYFGIGIAICIYPLIEAIEDRNFRMNFEMIQVLNDEPPLLERVITPLSYAFGFILFVTLWPITAAYMLFQYLQCRKDDELLKTSRFYCRMEYVGNKVNPKQFEKEYVIHDPISLTPEVPFGFLNPAWNQFVASCDKNEQLIAFYIPKGSVTNHFKERAEGDIRGVVRMQGKKIVDEFLLEGYSIN